MKFKKLHSGNDVNIFSEIAAQALAYNAVNLSQGSPDFPMDCRLKNFLKEALDTDVNQFAASPIIPELLENLISFNAKRELPVYVNEKQITICPGATYGIYVSLATFLEPGDEVIVFEPCYETYSPAIEIRKARTVYVALNEDFNIDWNLLEDKISDKTKAIIVNSPHNPTGKIWTETDWEQLWQLIKNTEIIVISDEVYDQIYYDGKFCRSAFHHPELKNRCFCVYSFEKMFHVSGWKSSYILASEEFSVALNSVHQYLTFTINIFAQHALAKYLKIFSPETNRTFFQEKRNLFNQLFADLPFEISEIAEAGYFQTVKFSHFEKGISDHDFALHLIRDFQVAAIPYSAFYHDRRDTGYLRFCFAKKDETLYHAAENLQKLCIKKAPLL